ncbi:MAG: F0F1 ATP synthase subunit alpha, partial [Clostridiales bacterium]|nr:F0F1 ATP synthase subunit alpha [Clostridiales bacterium]
VSRVGGSAQLKGMKKVAGTLKLLYSQYRELQYFAQFGSDLDADTKARLALGERIVEVLKQKRNSPISMGCQVAIVYAVINGWLDDIPVERVAEYEQKLFEKIENDYPYFVERIEQNQFEEYDIDTLKKALEEMKGLM